MSIKRPAVLAFTFLFLFVFVMSDMTEVRAAEEKNGNNVKIASDIKGHWAGTALADFNQKGYLKGDENGNLNPDKTMSRAEYAAVINRVMQFSQESGDISKFTDVKPDDWYRADLAKALKAGYMKGTGESTMSPKATITREQAFVMLYRLTYPKGADMKNAADLKKFNDGAQVSEYAREAISVLAAKGVITGEYGNLNPKKDISRAQAVLVLSKSEKQLTIALNAMNEQEFVGSGAGYGGTLKVKVLFNKGKIVDIKIISSSETGSYLARAEKIIAQIIEKQSVDGIDNVSGATLSCNAIKDAVRDCISQQKGKGSIGTFGIKGKNRGEGAADPKKELRFEKLLEGKYIGVASGHYTDSMKAEVTVNSDGNITDISYTSGDDKVGYMTDEWAQETIKKIKKTKSTLDIDTISGATNSCNGLINAIVNALEQAVPEKIISESCDLDGAKYNLAKIIAAGVTVANLDAKKLEIGEDVKDGEVTLENSVIRGDLIVKGGGSNSIHLSDVKIEGNTIIEKPAGERVRLVVENGTQIGNKLQVKTPAIIETDKISEIDKVELPRSFESSKETTINANIKKLNIRTQTANIKVKNGSTVGDIGLPEVVEEYSPQKKHYQGNGGKFNLNIEGGTTVASGSNKNSVTSDFNDGTYYGESYGFSTSERQNKNGERKGFTFPKKNLVKVKIENGKVTQAEIELFADDDDDGANYSKGAKNVIEYLKKTNLEEAYEKIHKTKHAGEIAAVSGATRSANGVLRALDKALSDAKEGETQVYKAMWLANEPSRVVEHIWTEKEKEKYDQLTGEEKEKYKKEIEKVTTKQYFGEQLRLTPSSVRLIKTTVPIPEVTKENKATILNLGEEIAHTDFASNGIEAFVTDKRGNRIDENKVINRKDGDENTADFKLHWLHKSSGLEIIKEVQLQRKSVYIPLSRMQLEFTDGSFEYVYIKTGNESMQGDNVYEHTMDLRGKELKDIKLFKKDSTEVKLQSFGSGSDLKHYYIADVNKYRIKVVEDVSDVLKKNPNELVKFEFDIYGVNLHQDLSKLDNEDKNNTLELKLYREPNKRVYDAGEKLNLEGIYVKRTAVDDSFTKDIYSSNYDTYLKLTRKDTNEEVAHDTVFTNDDKGKEVTFVLTTKDKAAKSVEFTVTVNGDKEVKFIKVFDATTNEELAKVEVTLDKDNLKFNAATDLKLPSKYKGKKNDIKVKSYCNETEEFGEVTVKALRVAFYQFVVKLPGLDDGYICSGRPVWE